ncbi:hypothetical protein EYF80_017088 [Liparis tanakae]|uniref:Uncharacterized protein n=1 Tax=Liparis tanakae TaxID=230148 RepID=A0A4Z2I3J2_9TELE|nr:hypothetical protein EYF80_017088 [Liparis tanakae]
MLREPDAGDTVAQWKSRYSIVLLIAHICSGTLMRHNDSLKLNMFTKYPPRDGFNVHAEDEGSLLRWCPTPRGDDQPAYTLQLWLQSTDSGIRLVLAQGTERLARPTA